MRRLRYALVVAAMAAGPAVGAEDAAVDTCRAIVATSVPPTYAPGVDVRGNPVPGPNYVPGVDVRGNPVAPAGTQTPNVLPDQFEIPVTPRVFDFLGTTPPLGLKDLTVNAGTLTIRRADGQVLFNGMPLGVDPGAELARGCRQLLLQHGVQ